MKINNEHVGWSIIGLIASWPFIYSVLSPTYGVFKTATRGLNAMADFWAGAILLVAVFVIVLTLISIIAGLIEGDIQFEWEIKLPKIFGRSKAEKARISHLLEVIRSTPQGSPEWIAAWKELDDNEYWG